MANAGKLRKAVVQLREFGEWLLATPCDQLTLAGIAAEALRVFSLDYCSIHVLGESKWEHLTGSAESNASEEVMDRVKLVQDHTTDSMDLADESLLGVRYMKINMGTTPVALLAVKSDTLATDVMGTLAYMVGIRINTLTNGGEPHNPC